MPELSAAELLDARLKLYQARADILRTEKFRLFRPYEPQAEFFSLGAAKRERVLLAGNQLGKTVGGAFEMTCHLTGIYPPWWTGKRFAHPVFAIAGGETSEQVRDKQQLELCGPPGDPAAFGTGFIPKELIAARTLSHGVTGAFDTLAVRHSSGGTSTLSFKSYVQGRSHWQSVTCHVVWEDEEPPSDIHDEALARLTGDGILYVTCTPLKGKTLFVRRFMGPYKDADEAAGAVDRAIVRMGLVHVSHFTEEQKEQRLRGYEPRLRRARAYGDPVMEAGLIYETPLADLVIPAQPGFLAWIPEHWRRIWGLDFGGASAGGHPFAAALCAIEPRPAVHPWEKDNDVFYVLHTMRMRGTIPTVEASAIKRIALNVPVAWPHDGTHTEKSTGEQLAEIYRKEGLNMLAAHATHDEAGGYQVWPGITEINNAMRMGRFKVAETCHEFKDEYEQYHTDDNGKIFKEEDDVMDAVRAAWMMRRKARSVPLGGRRAERQRATNYTATPFRYF